MRSKRREHLQLLAKFMSTPDGRAYFHDLLVSCHIFSTSFAPNALSMAFNEGNRNVGLRLAADITEASPDLFLQMLRESNERPSTVAGSTDDDGSGGNYRTDDDNG